VARSYQPTAQQYPPHRGPLDSREEALAQVRASGTEQGEAALWAAHTRHWLEFWGAQSRDSFVSVPDTRLEALYFITQAKLQGAMSTAAAPGGITDQLGPYRGDLSRPANRDPLSNGSAWVGLWFDWNVEENYWGVARANHVGLFAGLLHGLRLPAARAAMRANAEILIGESSGAMALAVGIGQNLRMTGYWNESAKEPPSKPGIAHSTRNTSLAGTVVFRAALFASRQVWRACSSHHNLTCLRDDLLPLLRGGIEFYRLAPPDLNQTTVPLGAGVTDVTDIPTPCPAHFIRRITGEICRVASDHFKRPWLGAARTEALRGVRGRRGHDAHPHAELQPGVRVGPRLGGGPLAAHQPPALGVRDTAGHERGPRPA
jgi:hypothetical protein